MARILYEKDSTNRHLSFSRRHRRLLRRVKNGDQYAERIKPFEDELRSKQKQLQEFEEQREDAQDDVLLADSILDDEVRTTFEKLKQEERHVEHSPILKRYFPDGTFGTMIEMPFATKAREVEILAKNLEGLGANHPLNMQAGFLKEKAAACKKALAARDEVIEKEKYAENDVDRAKAALRTEYEKNYLDLRKEFGKAKADRMFPVLRNGTDKASADEQKKE